ncbi:DUF4247 domain-containing protein [Pontibacillus yanchengensis]|uniref:DUF4247 domain-containing protein n=1 Tax=Pontibacillus yanchengensis TaxID=462910 RepID=A0A6I4ZY94_9BACI|nr:DUF4247 domain-containing protein [Pontibacillus yanchengensis]MYL34124.1 DUF4247 domain-containing protein [Pontibacillus yanchengensis]
MRKNIAIIPLFLSALLVLSSCAQGGLLSESDEFFGDAGSGMSGTQSNTYTFPDEPTKETLQQEIKDGSFQDPQGLLSNVFPLIDTVRGQNNQEARIYVTQQFTIEELSNILTERFKPDRESDLVDGKKALIYSNYFITLQQSEQNQDAILMEIASNRFVRDNYSPNFFNGLFALWILDEVLDVDDWHKKRKRECLTGNCYGGYSSSKYRPGSTGGIRGSSGTRGGGPSTGK